MNMKPGDIIIDEHYELREAHQTGVGMEVWQVLDRKLKRECILKMPATPPETEDEMQRHLAEARAMAAISDKAHVAEVYEFGIWEGRPYFTQELLPGGSLAERIRDAGGKLPVNEALQIAVEICEGVLRAHEAGLMHGDLKPENVAFAAHGCAKVIDFGTVRWLRRETQTLQGIMATLAYQAPEQFSARYGSPDHRTDIWQMGVIVALMLSGRHPYEHSETALYADVFEAVCKAPELEHVPSECRAVVKRCLQPEKKRRYQHIGDLLKGLKEVLKQATETPLGRSRELMKQGIQSYEDGNFSEARKLLRESAKLRPNVHVFSWLGMTYECIGNYDKARAAYMAALEIDPENTVAKANLARLNAQHPPTADAVPAKTDELPADKEIVCRCGRTFTWTIGEQKFFEEKGFDPPKRCPICQEEKKARKKAMAERTAAPSVAPTPQPVAPAVRPAPERRQPSAPIRHVGKVKMLAARRDWGFIMVQDMPDFYFHVTAVRNGNMPMREAQVLFEVGPPGPNGKPTAVNVEPL